jgi:hypothetical protein
MTTPASGPTVSVATDKASYNVNDPITVTVTYADDQTVTDQLTVTVTVTDGSGNTATGTAQAGVTVVSPQPMTAQVSDSFGDTYTEQPNQPVGTAVFTSTVGTPPASA